MWGQPQLRARRTPAPPLLSPDASERPLASLQVAALTGPARALASSEAAVRGKGAARPLWVQRRCPPPRRQPRLPLNPAGPSRQGAASLTPEGTPAPGAAWRPCPGHGCVLQPCGRTPLSPRARPWSLQAASTARRDPGRRRQDAQLAAGGQMRVFGGDARASPLRQTRVKVPGRESSRKPTGGRERRGAGPAPAPRRGEPRTPHPAPSSCSTAGRRVGRGRAPGKEPSGPGALTVCQVLVRGLPSSGLRALSSACTRRAAACGLVPAPAPGGASGVTHRTATRPPDSTPLMDRN